MGHDDEHFATDLSRVTLSGIVVVAQCKTCAEIFVPQTQRLGILNPEQLRDAVKKDSVETGEPILANLNAVQLSVEKMNAQRKGDIH